jgi:microcystin-dependent protein
MALNFPANPAIGDIYRDQGVAFQWTGTVWVALGSSPNLGVPTGTVAYFAGKTPPDGWLLCNNQPVTALYPSLRDYLLAAGSPFGVQGADPRVPELRGEFIRGFDGGRGVDAGRVFGSSQLDQLQRLVGQLVSVQTVGTGLATSGILRQLASTASAIWQGATSVNRNTTMQLDTAFDPTVRSGDETRPRNIALLPCIKAFDAVDITGMADLSALLTAIATPAEAIAGVSNEKLMTPFNVRAVLDEFLQSLPQSLPMLGVGQGWQDMAGQRLTNTTYQNTTGKPIEVRVRSTGGTGTVSLSAGAAADTLIVIDAHVSSQSHERNVGGIIPPDWFYRFAGTVARWTELR